MGSFKGHVLPGTFFLLVGAWHAWSALVRFTSNPKAFRVRVWNPVPGYHGKVKYLELYLVVFGSFIDLCIEFLYSSHLKFFVNGVLNPSHMNNFEHSGMLLMFFIFGVITLLSEKTRLLPLPDEALALIAASAFCAELLPLPDEALALIAASAFCAEYLLFYFHSTTHKGLEGYYHLILVLLIGLCILSTVAGALLPSSFPVDLANGVAVTLQGLWFYQTAFTLYGPMIPDGCQLKDDEITCTKDSEVRGELLANFQLFSLILGVLIMVAAAYGFAASRYRQSNIRSLHMVQIN